MAKAVAIARYEHGLLGRYRSMRVPSVARIVEGTQQHEFMNVGRGRRGGTSIYLYILKGGYGRRQTP